MGETENVKMYKERLGSFKKGFASINIKVPQQPVDKLWKVIVSLNGAASNRGQEAIIS